jgi:hypothetical protein
VSWKIDEEDIIISNTDVDPLGRGRFGVVYRGLYRGQTVALKVLENVSSQDVKKEFDIMR